MVVKDSRLSEFESESVLSELPVTKAFLPDLKDYQQMVARIWESGWLTNNGACLREFEEGLQKCCESPFLSVVNNGTIALQIAVRALDITGEVITTPFSYVATSSSLVWENCSPVYADIDPVTFNISPASIEALITPQTTAIVATHVFGVPCDIDGIERIANKHGIKVIYDAAHAFNVSYNGRQLVTYGDISTLSFHATKLFHSIEGGAVVASNKEVFDKVNYMRNFGHKGHDDFQGLGINGKMSEFHAAMGVLNLRSFDRIFGPRKTAWELYASELGAFEGIQLQGIPEGTDYNWAYFSVVLESEKKLLEVIKVLNSDGIFPRRYFHPSLNRLPYTTGSCPIAEDISSRIICLPLFSGITDGEQARVIASLKSALE